MVDLVKLLARSLRDLSRQPLVSGLALLALAIGIALVTLMFSILQGIFLREPPQAHVEDVYRVTWSNVAEGIASMPVTTAAYLEWRNASGISDIAAFIGTSISLSDDGALAERTNGAYVTPSLFSVVRAVPVLGRPFLADEGAPSSEPSVILSDDLWSARYQKDPSVLGRKIRIDGQLRTVVGIMPPGFRFPLNQYLWIPLQLSGDPAQDRNELQLLVRLKKDFSPQAARAQLSAIAVPLTSKSLNGQQGAEIVVQSFMEAYNDPQLREYLKIMLIAAIVVLVISSVNVASILLVRATARANELALRRALGARIHHLLSHPLAEALVLTLFAGLVGLLLAHIACRWVESIVSQHLLSYWVKVSIDPWIFLATIAASLLISMLAGSFPAWRALGLSTISLRDQASGMLTDKRIGRLHRGLVILQVALTFGMLVPAALIFKSLTQLNSLDLGFEPKGVITAQLSLPPSYDALRIAGLIKSFEERVGKIPGVRQVSSGNFVPGESAWNGEYEIEGSELASGRAVSGLFTTSTPGFFQVFGVQPLYGRDFTPGDDFFGVTPAIVTESLAKQHFTDPSAIVGHRLRFKGSENWKLVVGVIPDSILGTALPERTSEAIIQKNTAREKALFFLPFSKVPNRWISLVIATRDSVSPGDLTPLLRRELSALDPQVPLFWVQTMGDRIETILWDYRLFGGLFILFGGVALLQTTLGLFATIQLGVTRRLREMGLRMALGASPASIQMLIFKECGSLLTRGAAGGSLIAIGLVQALRSLVYGAEAWSWILFVTTAGVLAGAGLAAGWLPARRAATVDPAPMLRGE